MTLRESLLGRIYYNILRYLFILKIKEKGLISPEKITLIGCILSIFVPLGFYLSPMVGILLILFSAIADSLDGQLARENQQDSLYGAFLDSTLDRVSDYFYLLGFWVVVLKDTSSIYVTILFSFALLLTLLFSYTKARIEGLGGSCNVGAMERAARVIYLIVLGVIISFIEVSKTKLILIGIFIYNIALLVSVLQRIVHAKKILK